MQLQISMKSKVPHCILYQPMFAMLKSYKLQFLHRWWNVVAQNISRGNLSHPTMELYDLSP